MDSAANHNDGEPDLGLVRELADIARASGAGGSTTADSASRTAPGGPGDGRPLATVEVVTSDDMHRVETVTLSGLSGFSGPSGAPGASGAASAADVLPADTASVVRAVVCAYLDLAGFKEGRARLTVALSDGAAEVVKCTLQGPGTP
ncbi:hypothetical protein AB0M29_33670 [Streptomyces sp. NPDC051976]|uniref:hypothetical protein n=1 Tax=Streptomyces sp. NPDC051976 TaxID=3154947 RepID=UPI0034427520